MASFTITWVTVGLPSLIISLIGGLIAAFLAYLVIQEDQGTPEMIRISKAIRQGAKAFLKYEYAALAVMVAALFVLVTAAVNWRTGICYLVGVTSSATCGYIGMMIAVQGNTRTAKAAEAGLNAALRVAFNSGSVMGLCVVSLALGCLSCLLMIFDDNAITNNINALTGFGMGASTLSIFARVGGGIFTKAADVGADLVAKVEKNIPEDDVRNPATIADNVGDNVGDTAGMGADLFGSFAGSIIASSLLGYDQIGAAGVAVPFWISGAGIISAVLGMMLVRTKEGATQHDLLVVLRRAQLFAGLIQVGLIALVIGVLDVSWKLFGCIVIGLAAGIVIAIFSEFMTSGAYYPTQSIVGAATAGPAGVIIQGLAVGYMACVLPTLIVASVVLAALELAGMYGIALASTGVLSTLGITLATDAYGPVSDNAGGIAEMAHMAPHVRENTDILDALGNTTAAVGKGFAVVSAILTGISLVSSFVTKVGITTPNLVTNKFGLAGILIGAMLPMWFSAMTMTAVAKSAQGVVVEVRRQFAEIKGLWEGTADADYASCVRSIMMAALHAMLFPVLLVILAPLIIGIGLGPECLTGMLIGTIVSGLQVGCSQNTSGGAFDNAKKYVENELGMKRSELHKACVVGDTLGDPFKDTSGPAINILVKLSSYISVTLVPVFKNQADYWWVSLILIGLLIIFVPFWMSKAPKWGDLGVEAVHKMAAQYKANLAAQHKTSHEIASAEAGESTSSEAAEVSSTTLLTSNGKESDAPASPAADSSAADSLAVATIEPIGAEPTSTSTENVELVE
eukprot:ANDGO_06590.mRNA.1 Putative K(+)-stimulated pyrophosphate-energized sodium pump